MQNRNMHKLTTVKRRTCVASFLIALALSFEATEGCGGRNNSSTSSPSALLSCLVIHCPGTNSTEAYCPSQANIASSQRITPPCPSGLPRSPGFMPVCSDEHTICMFTCQNGIVSLCIPAHVMITIGARLAVIESLIFPQIQPLSPTHTALPPPPTVSTPKDN